jgi:hypothetical protein
MFRRRKRRNVWVTEFNFLTSDDVWPTTTWHTKLIWRIQTGCLNVGDKNLYWNWITQNLNRIYQIETVRGEWHGYRIRHGNGNKINVSLIKVRFVGQDDNSPRKWLTSDSVLPTQIDLKNAVFWDVAPCRYFVNRRFWGTYRLHLQGIRNLNKNKL